MSELEDFAKVLVQEMIENLKHNVAEDKKRRAKMYELVQEEECV